ncbi:MAG: acyl carrier protein [Gammaproteobacteria bacterium]|nr:acyl carrier protein [Gammaproteobacteria bacterium]
MHTKESIYAYLVSIFVDLFEVEASAICLEARLYEDLDIDSIDAVDMVIKLKELTGKKIQPEAFKNVRTVQNVVEAVYELVNED